MSVEIGDTCPVCDKGKLYWKAPDECMCHNISPCPACIEEPMMCPYCHEEFYYDETDV